MKTLFARALTALARWADRKGLTNPLTSTRGWVDRFRRVGSPSAGELFAELKNTAYACAALNAAACAAHPPRLFIRTGPGQAAPRCATKALSRPAEDRLRTAPHLAARTQGAVRIEEVVEHPLLTLFRAVNEEHNHWDLWELTTLAQEATGSAYWLIESGPFGPYRLWPLPPQTVRAVRAAPDGPVSAYECHAGGRVARYERDEVVAFKYPDPKDPYGPGLSPLRACWEHVLFDSEYVALKRAKFTNHALPGVILSPDEVLSEDQARRLEEQWNLKMREGGQGQAVVAEAGLRVQLLSQSLGDLSALAEVGASKEVIANAFGVPASYLFRETNLANLQAAETFHASFAVRPRLLRRDEKLNERLVPLFDPTGRLFLASDDPRPADKDRLLQMQSVHVQTGIRTVNEVRSELGLPPVSWGDAPPWQAGDRPA